MQNKPRIIQLLSRITSHSGVSLLYGTFVLCALFAFIAVFCVYDHPALFNEKSYSSPIDMSTMTVGDSSSGSEIFAEVVESACESEEESEVKAEFRIQIYATGGYACRSVFTDSFASELIVSRSVYVAVLKSVMLQV